MTKTYETPEGCTTDKSFTVSGKVVSLGEAPDPGQIWIEDIAHALSMQCRYAGHILHFYSVAQHSIICMFAALRDDLLCPTSHLRALLLHDAAEAYTGDIIRPVKRNCPFVYEAEARLQETIFKKFRVEMTPELHEFVKYYDNRVLQTEINMLMPNHKLDLGHKPVNVSPALFSEGPREIFRATFLAAYRYVNGEQTSVDERSQLSRLVGVTDIMQ